MPVAQWWCISALLVGYTLLFDRHLSSLFGQCLDFNFVSAILCSLSKLHSHPSVKHKSMTGSLSSYVHSASYTVILLWNINPWQLLFHPMFTQQATQSSFCETQIHDRISCGCFCPDLHSHGIVSLLQMKNRGHLSSPSRWFVTYFSDVFQSHSSLFCFLVCSGEFYSFFFLKLHLNKLYFNWLLLL